MPKIKATKAVTICRVSTEQQRKDKGKGSLDAQDYSVSKYVDKNKFDVLAEFPDIVESGFRGSRKQFKAILKKVEGFYEEYNEPIAIIVDTMDRLTREWKLWVTTIDRLREEGKVEIHIAEDGFVLHQYSPPQHISDAEGKIQDAKKRSLRTSADVRRTLRYKLSRGEYYSPTPTGYLNIHIVKEDRIIEKKIIKDKERASLVKEAFELYATDNYSIQELTKLMKNKGLTIKPKKGKVKGKAPVPLTKSALNWILRNRFYTGEFELPDPDTREKKIYKATNYEPLISKDLWNRVQKKLDEKAQKYSTHHSSIKFFKFRGLVRCGFCGCVLTPNDLSSNYKNKKPGEEVYYRCTYSKKAKDAAWYKDRFGTENCPQRYWKEDEIEDAIKGDLAMLHYDEKEFQALRDALNSQYQTRIQLSQAQKKSLEIDLKEKEKLKDALLDKMVLAERKEDEFYVKFELDMKKRLETIRKEIESIKEEIKALEEMEKLKTDEFVDTLILCSNLKEQYEKLSDLNKRNLVFLAFKSITAKRGETKFTRKNDRPVVAESIEFEWNEPFNMLLKVGLKKLIPQLNDMDWEYDTEYQTRIEAEYYAQEGNINKIEDKV